MILTLLSTTTIDDDTSVDITSNITSSYDEYMFVLTDIRGETDGYTLNVGFNAAGQSGFDEFVVTTYFYAHHNEADDTPALGYSTYDEAGAGYAAISSAVGSTGADESVSGVLHLFSPASTTYVKQFYSRFSNSHHEDGTQDVLVSGYVNVTAAIDEISFKMASGDVADGLIQMYGVA